MTTQEKEKIIQFKTEGKGAKAIASALGMPLSTVKSFIRRDINKGVVLCKYCGKHVNQTKGKKKKEFCCDDHRMKWWSEHRSLLKFKDERTSVCQNCGKHFQHHGSRVRRYCSYECFLAGRYGHE